ncbi:bacillithiol system redox-active protein YtxJ [Paenibacillus aceris]|uniref:Bacillithiol system protein YtxJ n=1 Tax=Paenibacillus aceris TaxID=869555 RepID=A0ABS4HSW2_9BACL|nr:bacillithiol system redox-active protein YtxJ [Paenibacillus aceris]MBP1961712.1 bacillithiol system protein YtxJ [Paenibacillus aceris]NHW34429.1 bacillithiol system redox-active protein YtxJ [Paenibacillus aceris]
MSVWKELTTVEQWQEVLDRSADKPTVVLKHSTTCPVSASALEEYEEYLSGKPNNDVDYYLVKVIESRPVSNQIAEDLAIKHASPQILYFKNKESIWNTSHWSVTTKHITAVLD